MRTMTLALLGLLVFAQTEAPPEAVTPPSAPVRASPGWAREGAANGFVLAAAPIGFAIGSVIALWTRNGTTQDWLSVAAGLSAPLGGLVPTMGGRSAVLSDEAGRRPRILRIVGWVMIIYGAAALVGGVAIGQVYKLIARGAMFTALDTGTGATVLQVIGTVTTLFDGAICSAGVIMLSAAANVAATRAEQEAGIVPGVALTPLPGGGFAVMAGVSGRL